MMNPEDNNNEAPEAPEAPEKNSRRFTDLPPEEEERIKKELLRIFNRPFFTVTHSQRQFTRRCRQRPTDEMKRDWYQYYLRNYREKTKMQIAHEIANSPLCHGYSEKIILSYLYNHFRNGRFI